MPPQERSISAIPISISVMANNTPSKLCLEALALLATHRNVLISGPPGAGKSKLLGEIAHYFTVPAGKLPPPKHDPKSDVPLKAPTTFTTPAPAKKSRKVFRTVFHQTSKHRDFVSGIAPTVVKAEGAPAFRVVKGQLLHAADHAKGADGVSLLIVDEINRGPAVQIFGGSLVAIESDKRLAADGKETIDTQKFEIMDPATGEVVEYALPSDLYILAAMNQADASVEPLDVAFLRRWEMLRLEPDEEVLRNYYNVAAGAAHPAAATAPADVYNASVQAWLKVNSRIRIGKGADFQVGHGVLMGHSNPATAKLDDALRDTAQAWEKIRAHVEEVFFGDLRAVATVLNATDAVAGHPYKLTETSFAGDPRLEIKGPTRLSSANIYEFLKAVAS